MIALSLRQNNPLINPTEEIVDVTFSGNYVTGGDTLDLTASKIADPNLLGVLGPSLNPPSVEVVGENLGGAYVEVIPGTAVNNWKLQAFAAGGAEETGGAAYPAAFLAGKPVQLRIVFSQYDR